MSVTTKIEAVNTILSSIGEAPVNDLTGASLDVGNAIRYLEEASREIQSMGLWFNTETQDIQPFSGTGEYRLPISTLSAVPTLETKKHFVQRGNRLYNTTDNKYDGNTDELSVELILELDFQEIPEEARSAIMAQAARKFTDRTVGATNLHQFAMLDESMCRRRLMSRHLEEVRWNSDESPRVYDALSRRRL